MGLLQDTINKIGKMDEKAMEAARARQDMLTKPQGSLGRLEDLSVQLAGIQGKEIPVIRDKAVITMAGDHGVVAEGVGNWPQEVTAQMVLNFLGGGAAINALTSLAGARIIVVDMGVASELPENPKLLSKKVAPGTNNIMKGPAMTEEQAIKAIETGIEIINAEAAKGLDIVGTGDMGIGNTTASAAIYASIMGLPAGEVTGRGTGITDEQLAHKTEVVKTALEVNKPDGRNGLDVLAKVGGYEIGGLAGVILGAAALRIPVVIDGFISGAAALVATSLAPNVRDFLIASHMSAEAGHRKMLEYMGKEPLLDLGLRLGEGTGGALSIILCEAAAKVLAEMATFGEAGVSEENE